MAVSTENSKKAFGTITRKEALEHYYRNYCIDDIVKQIYLLKQYL